MPQLSEFLLIQPSCVVAVEPLYVFSLLEHAPTITVYPGKSSPVETAIDLQLAAILANAGTGVASRTPLNYRWISGLAQNTPLTALVPDSNPGSSSADNASVPPVPGSPVLPALLGFT